jgi:hypothetical protein
MHQACNAAVRCKSTQINRHAPGTHHRAAQSALAWSDDRERG